MENPAGKGGGRIDYINDSENCGVALKAGDKCKGCGEILRESKAITSKGCKNADKTFLACRCLHPGDYFCNCGKPCWSFF